MILSEKNPAIQTIKLTASRTGMSQSSSLFRSLTPHACRPRQPKTYSKSTQVHTQQRFLYFPLSPKQPQGSPKATVVKISPDIPLTHIFQSMDHRNSYENMSADSCANTMQTACASAHAIATPCDAIPQLKIVGVIIHHCFHPPISPDAFRRAIVQPKRTASSLELSRH